MAKNDDVKEKGSKRRGKIVSAVASFPGACGHRTLYRDFPKERVPLHVFLLGLPVLASSPCTLYLYLCSDTLQYLPACWLSPANGRALNARRCYSGKKNPVIGLRVCSAEKNKLRSLLGPNYPALPIAPDNDS